MSDAGFDVGPSELAIHCSGFFEFIDHLDGLNGDELFWLAHRVIDRSQTDADCGYNDVTPQLLASKGLVKKVPLVLDMRNPRVAFTIDGRVWQYLVQQEKRLLERCAAANQARADRMRILSPALAVLNATPGDPKL